jgi:tetratricopeptide (TPR) repeat protein
MILNYHDWEADQLAIGEALKPNYDDRNVSPDELADYTRQQTDLEALVLYGLELDSLKAILAIDLPVIIEKGLDLGAPHGWMGHYLTLYGYDEGARVFYGLDTFLGPWDSSGRPFEYASLETLWAQFNRATVVIFPPERANELVAALGPVVLDEQAMWLAAVEQAQRALAADVEDAFAWFDLGASLYHLGIESGDDRYFEQAAAAFDRAREIGLPWRTLWYQFEPYLAYIASGRFDEVLALTDAVMTTSGGRNIEETYLFRGHALLATGDQQSAEQAYARALRLNPGLGVARESLDALQAAASNGNG